MSADSLSTRYVHGLNSDAWRGGLMFQRSFTSGLQFFVQEFATSSRLGITNGPDKWKDRQRLVLGFSRPILQRILLTGRGSGLVFSDKQSGFTNDIRTHLLGVGATYHDSKIMVPFFIAHKDDRRFGQQDAGVNLQVGMNAPDFRLGEYRNRLITDFEADWLDRRTNRRLSVSYLVNREFFHNTNDSLFLNLNQLRRDYYVSATGIIESREETRQSAENNLNYRIASDLDMRIHGAIGARDMKISLVNGPHEGQERQRKDYYMTGAVQVNYQKPDFWGHLSFRHATEEQTFGLTEGIDPQPFSSIRHLSTPDNQSALTTLTLLAGWRYTHADSLIMRAMLQRFRYDTPDNENYDDRDELRFWLDLQNIHTFNPSLQVLLALNVNVLHFVYIFGQKSANNHWTRILRLQSTVSWKPSPRWSFSQTAEVLANYVDYDFESYFTTVRSFLYRKFQLEDSTSVRLSPHMNLRFHYRFELDENGKFVWDDWLEQKLIDRQSHTFSVSLSIQPWREFQVTPGYSLYSRKGYRYMTVSADQQSKQPAQNYHSAGPFIKLMYNKDQLRFILTGSTIAMETLTVEKQVLTRIDLRMNWTF